MALSIKKIPAKDQDVLLVIDCDYPESIVRIEVRRTLAVGQLRKIVKDNLKVSELDGFSWNLVSYGRDANHLTNSEDEVVLELSARNTLFLFAPSSVIPIEVKADEENKSLSLEEADILDSKYSAFKVETALSELAKQTGRKRILLLEFIDIYAEEVFASKELTKLPRETIIELVQRNTLNIEEPALYEAVLNWAKAQAQEGKAEALVIKEELKDVLPHIRFTLFNAEQLAKISSSNVVDAGELLAFFSYAALTKKAEEEDGEEAQKKKAEFEKKYKWNVQPRNPRTGPLRELSNPLFVNWAQRGYMFDVRVKRKLIIAGLSLTHRSTGTTAVTIYWRRGGWSGYESDAKAWQTSKELQNVNVTFVAEVPTRFPGKLRIRAAEDEVISFYIHSEDALGGIVSCGSHSAAGFGEEVMNDDSLAVLAGPSQNSLWAGERMYACGLIGSIHYYIV